MSEWYGVPAATGGKDAPPPRSDDATAPESEAEGPPDRRSGGRGVKIAGSGTGVAQGTTIAGESVDRT
ncbi:hypothetical protein [Kribbella pratensis]|uniref:Uncharacterized protein n=1 Tax=Kribbella pratensis TaxID=2512112 RepID=A0A4R8CKN6_9ACTN|nr:hypothetical protein [Kribbella pratensis]TDW76263.1 hypothetical protein EV653_1408 [Kribbella pratensis]